jgi:hypothetical protein
MPQLRGNEPILGLNTCKLNLDEKRRGINSMEKENMGSLSQGIILLIFLKV